MKNVVKPLTITLFVLFALLDATAQTNGYSLAYDRVTLYNVGFTVKTTRVSSDDNYLLFANTKPALLLRSRDKGDSFESVSQGNDYARVEDSPALYMWDDDKATIVGTSIAQTTGNSALTSNSRDEDFEFSTSIEGNGAVYPVRTFSRGVGDFRGAYTSNYGKSWSYYPSNIQPLSDEKMYSPVHGFTCRHEVTGKWYTLDTATRAWKEFPTIPRTYERLRCTSDGVLVGFTATSIAWLRPGDSLFAVQKVFQLPNKPDAAALQLMHTITWRDDRFYCAAKNGLDWYLLGVDRDSVHIVQLRQTVQNSKFQVLPIDERGCLVEERDIYGQLIESTLYSHDGKRSYRPELWRVGYVTDTEITWSDNSIYVTEIRGQMGHLYRCTIDDPRMEHVGRALTGVAATSHRSMSWCVLDTLDGRLIGRDAAGAIIEFSNDVQMRGFLITNGFSIYPKPTVDLAFEFSAPSLIVADSHFVCGEASAGIRTRNSYTGRGVYNANNPLAMLERGKENTFFFGRRDILQASYDGAVRDTIPVALPDETQDSIGVLSDIIELDSMNLVVALKGYKSQNYDGDSLGVMRGGIIRTTDRGVTWQRASVPTNDQACYSMQQLKSGALLAVSVDAAILTDTATKSKAVRCYSGNILRSTDQGATWTSQKSFALNNTTLTQCTWRIWQGNERIYIATPEAVMISTDDGQTWTAENDFPLNCIINGVAEFKGQLYVATTMGIYRENAQTSVTDQAVRDQPSIQASATHSGQAWRITVTGLPTSRIMGIDVYDIQGRQHPTEQLWSQDNTASITSPLPSHGVYGVVVHGPNGQRWTTAVGLVE